MPLHHPISGNRARLLRLPARTLTLSLSVVVALAACLTALTAWHGSPAWLMAAAPEADNGAPSAVGAAANAHAADAVRARFLRVEMPQPDQRLLNFAELQALDGDGRNVAQDARVGASTHRGDPDSAIDGDTSGENEGFHSRQEVNPWIELDFGEVYTVNRIVLWPRQRMADRLDGALLTLLDEGRKVVWHQRFARARQQAMTVEVRAFDGRHLGTVVGPEQRAWYDINTEAPGEYRLFPPVIESVPADQHEQVELPVRARVDADARRLTFSQRDSDAAVADLARRLKAALAPDAAGLQSFHRQMEQGDHRAALDAYREFFFARGVPGFAELLVNLPDVPDHAAESLMRNQRVAIGGDTITVARIGAPGAAVWVPHDAGVPPDAYWGRLAGGGIPDGLGTRHAFWNTDQGEDLSRQIEFFAEVRGPHFANFDELPAYYAATGSLQHLEKWMDYLDDWCLFGRGDIHRSPVAMVWATDHAAALAPRRVAFLHALAATRPAFTSEMRSTTLVRYLLALIEELPPHTIRSTRTQLANWGTLAKTGGLLKIHRMLPEFHATRYYAREAWRLWQAEWIHRNSPDGTVAENLRGPYRNVALTAFPAAYRDLVGTELEWREMHDNARRILRHNIGETPQSGAGFLHRDNQHWLEPCRDPVFDEPEMAARLQLFDGEDGGKPRVMSEITPYGGKFILRDSWAPDGRFFKMRNFQASSQDPLLRTEYTLGWADRDLADEPVSSSGGGIHYETGPLYALPLLVDRRGPHPEHGTLYPVGGKTEILTRAPQQVINTRFHTSQNYDLAEALQDAPYAFRSYWSHYWLPRSSHNHFVFGSHARATDGQDNAPVTGVQTWRRVISLRGTGIYIVTERVESAGEHDYTRPFHLGLALNDDVLEQQAAAGRPPLRIDADGRQVHTDLAGIRNLSLHFFGPDNPTFFNRFDRRGGLASIEGFPQSYPLGLHWRGRGNQLLVCIHQARNHDEAPIPRVEAVSGDNGTAGFSAALGDGTRVWYQAGRDPVSRLQAGPAVAHAESLLMVERDGSWSGLVIGAAQQPEAVLTLGNHRLPLPAADFEFAFHSNADADTGSGNNSDPGSGLVVIPIHRPIDRVRILPDQNVFTDTIDVSFDIPTQPGDGIEFRYTTDGSDPTIESPLYRQPVRLDETTLVKVRAFREGLGHTPYRQCGTDSSETFHALFTRESYRAAVEVGATEPGLHYHYHRDDIWTRLFAHTGTDGVLDVVAQGPIRLLLDPDEVAAIRDTDGPYSIVYRGYLQVPEQGVYGFHAPAHLYDVTMDAGYDLRLFVAGEEWRPAARLHAENAWHVALAAGLHPFEMRFVDFRHRPWKNQWWMVGRKEIVWQGLPEVELSGPGQPRQPIQDSWLRR